LSAAADDLHSAWAHLFAASLGQCGVAHAVISPGSRSTPLALALAAQLPSTVLHDERVAAFFALGQARASGRPSVVLATSGTAPGHWLPAVMEAREAGLPLLLLSADRPWEVQQAQASQTVDQIRLFGPHANGYFELGVPDAYPAAMRAVPRIAAQAVHDAVPRLADDGVGEIEDAHGTIPAANVRDGKPECNRGVAFPRAGGR